MAIKLVIVDDAPFIREVIRNITIGPDFDVVGEAIDGEEAVRLVEKTQPDVVLMDLVMPNKSGIEATQEIIDKWPKIKVIACSTLSEGDMLEQTMDAGFSDYINKPFTAEKLRSVIKKVVGG